MSALLIDVVMGGPGREAAVSRRSGAAIVKALAARGHDVAAIDLAGRLDPARLRHGAVVFNIVHGTYGEDGTLQSELDVLGKSYVGSDAAASRLCMDKALTKERLAGAGLRVAWGVRVHLGQPFSPKDLKLPHHGGLVLKPVGDGSSVGLRMVPNPGFVLPAVEELIAEVGPQPYLIEERLPGPEYTVAVLQDAGGLRALPPIRVAPAQGVYDYQAKYERDDTNYEIVADPALARTLSAIAEAAFSACGCRDIARADIMRTADGAYAVLELNTLPGFTDHSLTPKAAAAAGIGFGELAERLARRAAGRAGLALGAAP
jgi:D-alanine--D-alanine ligase